MDTKEEEEEVVVATGFSVTPHHTGKELIARVSLARRAQQLFVSFCYCIFSCFCFGN